MRTALPVAVALLSIAAPAVAQLSVQEEEDV
jgi:hypothetical protein